MNPMFLLSLCAGVAGALRCTTVCAQIADARDACVVARGGAVTADTADPSSTAINAAVCSTRTAPSFAFSSSPAFGNGELSTWTVVGALPVSPVALTAVIVAGSVSGFRAVTAGAGAAMYISETVAAGVRAGIVAMSIDRYGAATAFVVDGGLRIAVLPQLAFGASATNITGATIGLSRVDLPRVLRLGVAICPHDDLMLTVDAAGAVGDPGTMLLGARFRANDALVIRAGLSTEPQVYAAGATLNAGAVAFSYAYATRETLGPTHTVTILYSP